jgi:uncharacterized repeat protein (TIGR03803 family)
MLPKLLLTPTSVAKVVVVTLILAGAAWGSPKYKVLHAFGKGTDGGGLWGSLAFDANGNLYGTTSGGGAHGDGTVFELAPQADGTWTETILHSFPAFPDDGGGPMSTPVLDAAGSVYATTEGGGGGYTYGTVFELTPGSHGWKETVLHRFRPPSPAGSPDGPLVTDSSGSLYGTAYNPFELSLDSGRWKLTLLHDFPNGMGTAGGVTLDAAGNVYGVTWTGGTGKGCAPPGCGIAYELQPMPDGKWKEIVLHNFGSFGTDGRRPNGGLLLDSSANLYGTTDGGGKYVEQCSCGTVFKLTPDGHGRWKETILHSFTFGPGGFAPSAGVVMDKAGNLYGVTGSGGDPNCECGVVFKLSPGKDGEWKYAVLHRFQGPDGVAPGASLILDDRGNLYGTTILGGAYGAGVAFELTP